jgi:hypothetical protein
MIAIAQNSVRRAATEATEFVTKLIDIQLLFANTDQMKDNLSAT